MTLKFYLHDATTTNTGTMPSASNAEGTTPTVTATGATTARQLNGTIGVAQASGSGNTLAQTAGQSMLIRRFVSSPIAAQTIAIQIVTLSVATLEGSANSVWLPGCVMYLWRPGSGAKVGSSIFTTTNALTVNEPGTTETAGNSSQGSVNAATAQDGDIIVAEMWRGVGATQTMATAYANTVFYDGTTEGSATTNAAYVLFTNDVAMSTGGAAVTLDPMGMSGFFGG